MPLNLRYELKSWIFTERFLALRNEVCSIFLKFLINIPSNTDSNIVFWVEFWSLKDVEMQGMHFKIDFPPP